MKRRPSPPTDPTRTLDERLESIEAAIRNLVTAGRILDEDRRTNTAAIRLLAGALRALRARVEKLEAD